MRKFLGYPFKGVFYTVCIFFILYMAASYLAMKYWLAAAVFGIIFALFCWVFIGNCNLVKMDEKGITQYSFYFFKNKHYDWEDIKDVGIAFTNPLQRRNKKKGAVNCAFYFSDKQRTPQELMKLCISWPPKEVIHMGYSEKRLAAVLEYWPKTITLYNTTYKALFENAVVSGNHGFTEIVY